MRFLFAGAIAWAVLVQAAPTQAQQQAPNPLPPGEGRDIVAAACTQCHGPNAFTQLREGSDAWRVQIYDMILRGAQVQPSEIEPAVTYLATNFGPGINVPPAIGFGFAAGRTGQGSRRDALRRVPRPDRATSAKRAPAEWDGIMRRMIFLGAPVSGDEAKTIAAYLGTNYGAK